MNWLTRLVFRLGEYRRHRPGRLKRAPTLPLPRTTVVNVRDFGAVGDGVSHPLSDLFDTLAEAQAVYPSARALTDELDGVAIQKAINAAGPHAVMIEYVTRQQAEQNQALRAELETVRADAVSALLAQGDAARAVEAERDTAEGLLAEARTELEHLRALVDEQSAAYTQAVADRQQSDRT